VTDEIKVKVKLDGADRALNEITALSTGVLAGVAVFEKMSGAVAGIASKLSELGNELESQLGVINRLEGDISNATARVGGMINNLELMRASSRAATLGLNLTAEQFGTVSVAAVELSSQLGEDTLQVLEQLTEAVGEASPDALRKFGVELGEVTERSEVQRIAIEQLTRKYGDVSSSADTLGGQLTVLQTELDNAETKFLETLGAAGSFGDELDELKGSAVELAGAFGFEVVDGMTAAESAGINLIAAIQTMAQETRAIMDTMREFKGTLSGVASALSGPINQMRQLASLRSQLGLDGGGSRNTVARFLAGPVGMLDGLVEAAGGLLGEAEDSSGGGNFQRNRTQAEQRVRDRNAQRVRSDQLSSLGFTASGPVSSPLSDVVSGGRGGGGGRRSVAGEDHEAAHRAHLAALEREAEEMRRHNEQVMREAEEFDRANMAREAEVFNARVEAENMFREQQDAIRQEALENEKRRINELRAMEEEAFSERIRDAGEWMGVAQQATDGIVNAVMSGGKEMTAEQKRESIVKNTLAGLFAAARAPLLFFERGPAAAAAAGLSATMHFAAAGQAGGAATKPSGGSSSNTERQARSGPSPSASSRDNQQPLVINVNSQLATRADVGRAVEDALTAARRADGARR
jgi:flagellar biosynthesis GTPase FlhF